MNWYKFIIKIFYQNIIVCYPKKKEKEMNKIYIFM
jgi:hypothetical protein